MVGVGGHFLSIQEGGFSRRELSTRKLRPMMGCAALHLHQLTIPQHAAKKPFSFMPAFTLNRFLAHFQGWLGILIFMGL